LEMGTHEINTTKTEDVNIIPKKKPTIIFVINKEK
jgi:hypothetical protein